MIIVTVQLKPIYDLCGFDVIDCVEVGVVSLGRLDSFLRSRKRFLSSERLLLLRRNLSQIKKGCKHQDKKLHFGEAGIKSK